METKTCSKCKQLKPTSAFYTAKHHRDGLASACKSCRRVVQYVWNGKHPHKKAEYCRRSYRRNLAKKLAESAEYHRLNPMYQLKAHLRSSFGLTIQDVERMFADQSGKCANLGCGKEISLVPGTTNYRHVDHDHTKAKGDPGFIRGLLCGGCNAAAGLLKDSPDRCLGLGIYLESIR
jgi:hypothetical protein